MLKLEKTAKKISRIGESKGGGPARSNIGNSKIIINNGMTSQIKAAKAKADKLFFDSPKMTSIDAKEITPPNIYIP